MFEPNAIVLFVNVSVELVITIVPLASNIVIVLSAVSVIAKTVSCASSVSPSKVNLVSNTPVPALIDPILY